MDFGLKGVTLTDMTKAQRQFTAIYRKAGAWYLGWVEEIPGVNTQGKTLKETKENLKEALQLILEANKMVGARERGKGKVIREPLAVAA